MQLPTTIKMGHEVKDRVTGFAGTVTGIVFYLTGCHQALVTPKIKEDGSMGEAHWIDLQRLHITNHDVSVTLTPDTGEVGCDVPAPIRS